MKKVGNRMKRLEADISTKTKIFEKKPNKGGTPARDNIDKLNNFVRIFEEPKFDSEKSVLKFVVRACISVEKRRKEVTL